MRLSMQLLRAYTNKSQQRTGFCNSSAIRKILSALMIFILLCCVLLTGCSNDYSGIDYTGIEINTDTSANAIRNLTTFYYSDDEITSQNPFMALYIADVEAMSNLYDGLVSFNSDNEMIPAVALSWESSDDCRTWTFHLREDSYWVNIHGEIQRAITSDDFVTGLEWILNYGKSEATNVIMSSSIIAGAQDYLDYTSELETEDAINVSREVFLDMVGIEAPDPYTVVYHCIDSCPYFPSVTSFIEFFPAPGDHIEELGIDKFKINSIYDSWSNGPYIMTEFIPYNERILDANPHWYGNDENTRFMSITYKAVESAAVALQLYKNGELDYVELYDSQIRTIVNDEDSKYSDRLVAKASDLFPYVILFNYNKQNEDGSPDVEWNTAIANEAFRLSWYYGLDTTLVLKGYDYLDPYGSNSETIIPAHLVSTSDGTDYHNLVLDRLDLNDDSSQGIARLDSEKAEKYKQQAIEELTAQGVTFPIDLDYYIMASNQSSLDSALLLKNAFDQSLGSDYVHLNILTYTSSYTREVIVPNLYSFTETGWGADYGDPVSVLEQYLFFDEDTYLAPFFKIYTLSQEQLDTGSQAVYDLALNYTELFNTAVAIYDDLDARYEAFADAEAYLINHAMAIPFFNVGGWCISNIDVTDFTHQAFGCYNKRMVNISSDINGYTNEIWEGVEN